MKRREFMERSFLSATALVGAAGCLPAIERKAVRMPNYCKTNCELVTDSTPSADQFHFPAEWLPHEYCIMAFPTPQNWKGLGFPLRQVWKQWADVANTLSEYEPVLMAVRPEEKSIALKLCNPEIELFEVPLNDGWSRDSGPMFVVNGKGERRVAGFTFNGWGEKFPPFGDDALFKGHLCKYLDTPLYPIDFVLEGGAIAVDGEGTVLTTEECLLHPNRNSVGKTKVEKILNSSLGTQKVIWLEKGLTPDPVTDGHVDGIATFVEPGKILLHTTSDRNDPNYQICKNAKRKLESSTDAKGRQLEVVDLPLTSEDIAHMNFYLGNECVLVPTSGVRREDDGPLEILQDLFPNRKVIGINSETLAAGCGGIHCITQQVPKLK